MAPDLLSTIRSEIDERLKEMRPLLAEYEQLLVAADALVTTGRPSAGSPTAARADAPAKRRVRGARARATGRGSAAGVIELAASPSAGGSASADDDHQEKSSGAAETTRTGTPRSSSTSKPKGTARAARGAAREAILAALGHGSHTVGELAVVTAMSSPNINGNLRRLLSERIVVKTEREGKAAWALVTASS